MPGAPHQGVGRSRGARLRLAGGALAVAGCGLVGPREPEAPAPRMGSAITAVVVRPGSFAREPFAVTIEVRADAPSRSRMIRLAAGVDSEGARDRIVTFDGAELGTFRACMDGLLLDWPAHAQLRVELVEASAALFTDRFEGEFAVVPRGYVDTVVFPRFGHPTRRRGVPARRGDFLRLDASLYVANGTDEARTVDEVVSGIVHDGEKAQSWAIRLDRPLTVGPHSISEVRDFHLSYPLTSGFGQRLYSDRLQMLVSSIRGAHPSPGTATRSLVWGLMPGIAVDVVFVGAFTPEKRERAASLIIDGAGGYLEGAGLTLNRSLSRHATAAEIGMPELAIAELREVDGGDEPALLAAFQPKKSIERLTVYVVEGLSVADAALPAGLAGLAHAGAFRGGYGHPTDPKTPFRSPILVMPEDLGPGGFHSGAQVFAQRAAATIAAAIGGLTDVDGAACDDLNPFLPENVFNLMSAAGTYSWLLSPCQRAQLTASPSLYVY